MAITSEFIAAINQISAERGIEKEEIFKALESAILVAYKKEKFFDVQTENPEELGSNLSIELDRETGDFKLIATKEVVKKVLTNDSDNSVKRSPKKVTKVGRNDMCPCGSGKKYKQCCGK